MTDTAYWIVGFSGRGRSAQRNTDALLDNFIPETVSEIIVDSNVPASVVVWLDKSYGNDGYATATDIIAALKEGQKLGDEAVLVMALGEEPHKLDRQLAIDAIKAGIQVRDLLAGFDDVVLSDLAEASEPEVVPDEPQSAAERQTRPRRRSRTSATEKPAESVTEPPKRRGRPRKETTAEAAPAPESADSPPWNEQPGLNEAQRKEVQQMLAAAVGKLYNDLLESANG